MSGRLATMYSSPNYMHYVITMDSLRAGKHVFCEKPITVNYALSVEMKEEADRQGKMCSCRVRLACPGTFGVASRVQSTVSHFKTERGSFLETQWQARASSWDDVGNTWFFSSCGGILELRRGFLAPLVLAQGSPIFHSSCEGELGVALESLQGKRNLIQACV